MSVLSRRPAGLTDDELGRHRARVFLGQACVLGPSLVVPLRTLWECYQTWCADRSVPADSGHLRALLDEAPWAEVVERPLARGRLKTIVRGVGVRPTALLPAPRA